MSRRILELHWSWPLTNKNAPNLFDKSVAFTVSRSLARCPDEQNHSEMTVNMYVGGNTERRRSFFNL